MIRIENYYSQGRASVILGSWEIRLFNCVSLMHLLQISDGSHLIKFAIG